MPLAQVLSKTLPALNRLRPWRGGVDRPPEVVSAVLARVELLDGRDEGGGGRPVRRGGGGGVVSCGAVQERPSEEAEDFATEGTSSSSSCRGSGGGLEKGGVWDVVSYMSKASTVWISVPEQLSIRFSIRIRKGVVLSRRHHRLIPSLTFFPGAVAFDEVA